MYADTEWSTVGTSGKLAFDLFLLLMDGRMEKESWWREERKDGCGDLKGFLFLSCLGIQICGLSNVRCVLWEAGECGRWPC